VERLAASAVEGEVSVGCAGGGWRLAVGLRAAQPEELRQKIQRTQKAQSPNNGFWETCEWQRNERFEALLREAKLRKTVFRWPFKARLVS
jgi:hypothetical protein